MTFDHEVNLRQDFTDKLDLLDKAVDKVKKTGSQTALYDAVWQFSDEKLRNVPGRRVIVIITDGDDTFSRADHQGRHRYRAANRDDDLRHLYKGRISGHGAGRRGRNDQGQGR